MKVIRIIEHDGPDDVVRRTLERSLTGTYQAGWQRITGATLTQDDLNVMAEDGAVVIYDALNKVRTAVWTPDPSNDTFDDPVLPVPEWVSVVDEMPPLLPSTFSVSDSVVVYNAQSRERWIAYLHDGVWIYESGGRPARIGTQPTHWLRINHRPSGRPNVQKES